MLDVSAEDRAKTIEPIKRTLFRNVHGTARGCVEDGNSFARNRRQATQPDGATMAEPG